jgi:hypothetical protein
VGVFVVGRKVALTTGVELISATPVYVVQCYWDLEIISEVIQKRFSKATEKAVPQRGFYVSCSNSYWLRVMVRSTERGERHAETPSV